MSQGIRRPWQAVDYDEVAARLPAAARVLRDGVVRRARRHRAPQLPAPEGEGLARLPGAVLSATGGTRRASTRRRSRALDDLWQAPVYTVDDIRRSIDAHPPWGDYQGVTPADALPRADARVHVGRHDRASRGRPSTPQWDREVGAVLIARQLYMQGIRPGDVVLNSWAYGLHNGAFSFDEALHRWLNCVVLTTVDRQRDLQRAPGRAGHRLRGGRDHDHGRLPAAPGRRRPARWATTRRTDFKLRGDPQHR